MHCKGLERELATFVEHARQPLRAAVQHALHGGKRARGVLLLAVGEQTDVPMETLLRAAACAELLHAATLVQDDIFDGGCVRRGRPSVVCAFGPQLATLSSDWMLAEAIRAAYQLLPLFGEALCGCAQAMMAAEARESLPSARRDVKALREHAFAIAQGKTGELFGLALSAPHLLAGDLKRAERLCACGLELGVAFQYLDDALDLYGDQQAAGKELGRDLSAELYTMPMLDALPLLPLNYVHAWLDEARVPGRALQLLQATSVRQHVLNHAQNRWQAAIAACSQELASTSTVPQLLEDLISSMLYEQLTEPASYVDGIADAKGAADTVTLPLLHLSGFAEASEATLVVTEIS